MLLTQIMVSKVLEEVEALHKVRLMDFAAVSQPIKETKVEALHQVRPIELAAVSQVKRNSFELATYLKSRHLKSWNLQQDTVKQSEVPAMTSLRPRPVARAVQEPPAASHLKPPRLPRKSSPAAMFAIPKQEEFEENNNVTGFKKPVGDLVDGVTGSHEEVGTVLQYASAATAPTGEAKSLESGTSAKFRRHVRTASVVSRLIQVSFKVVINSTLNAITSSIRCLQGFEAVAAASNAPATPSRGGSFRIKRGSC